MIKNYLKQLWLGIVLAVVAFVYRTGKKVEQGKRDKRRLKQYEKANEIQNKNAHLNRAALLDRLYKRKK